MSKIEKYPSYKDSGVEWLGEIPEGWEVKKIKYLFKENSIKNHPDEISLAATQKYGVVPKDSLNFRTVEANISDLNIFKLVKINNFVISLRSFEGGIEYSEHKGIISPAYTIIEAIQDISYKYMKYLFKSNIFIQALNIYKTGIREGQNISFVKLKDDFLPFPKKQEQIKIASFLDTKTEQLDKTIKQKEQLIELLKERRQILINDAVTKGIDKTVAMKDSGVEWIGKIPEHWEVKRFKNIFKFSKGLTITKENLLDEGIDCINYGEIHSKYGFEVNPQIHKLKCVNKSYIKSDKKSLLNFGDFIFADTSEDIEGSGNFTYLNSTIKTFAGYHTVICHPSIEINSRFFAYEFDSLSFRSQIQKKVKGVKVYSITQGLLKDINIWIPPLLEQAQLVKIVDEKTSKINKAINLQEEQILKLKEYKTTLINSVVTGKVKVL